MVTVKVTKDDGITKKVTFVTFQHRDDAIRYIDEASDYEPPETHITHEIVQDDDLPFITCIEHYANEYRKAIE